MGYTINNPIKNYLCNKNKNVLMSEKGNFFCVLNNFKIYRIYFHFFSIRKWEYITKYKLT
jgi:hypothetical protein